MIGVRDLKELPMGPREVEKTPDVRTEAKPGRFRLEKRGDRILPRSAVIGWTSALLLVLFFALSARRAPLLSPIAVAAAESTSSMGSRRRGRTSTS